MDTTIEIDVIVLSYAQTEELKNVTMNCVQSIIASENPEKIKFNVLVVESEKSINPFQYQHTKTIYPEEEFNSPKYSTIGINITSAPYICLCNNDLLYQKEWATEILNGLAQFDDVSSASPICPYYPQELGIQPKHEILFGHQLGKEVQGACLFMKRDLLKTIGQLDPNFKFYDTDTDFSFTLRALNLKNILVQSSIVFHLGSTTLRKQSDAVRWDLTRAQTPYFENKWFFRLGKNWERID